MRRLGLGAESGLETLRMQNFQRKEKLRMNISLVNQSLMLAKQINRLEVKKERSWLEQERRT